MVPMTSVIVLSYCIPTMHLPSPNPSPNPLPLHSPSPSPSPLYNFIKTISYPPSIPLAYPQLYPAPVSSPPVSPQPLSPSTLLICELVDKKAEKCKEQCSKKCLKKNCCEYAEGVGECLDEKSKSWCKKKINKCYKKERVAKKCKATCYNC